MPGKQSTMLSDDRPHLTECDRCVLNFLQPSLMQEVGSGLGGSQIQQLLALFNDVLNQRAIVSLTIEGQIEFMTPQAEELLDRYFGRRESKTLPVCLDHWLKQQISQHSSKGDALYSGIPLHIEQSEQQLLIYWMLDVKKEKFFLLLEEKELLTFSIETLELLGLTRREAEVLFWVAKDKSNASIGKVLGCCEGTVRKHLEHLYNKLEVQTRMGAVMIALERLGLLQA